VPRWPRIAMRVKCAGAEEAKLGETQSGQTPMTSDSPAGTTAPALQEFVSNEKLSGTTRAGSGPRCWSGVPLRRRGPGLVNAQLAPTRAPVYSTVIGASEELKTMTGRRHEHDCNVRMATRSPLLVASQQPTTLSGVRGRAATVLFETPNVAVERPRYKVTGAALYRSRSALTLC
jgi:hypothetical protein